MAKKNFPFLLVKKKNIFFGSISVVTISVQFGKIFLPFNLHKKIFLPFTTWFEKFSPIWFNLHDQKFF